MTSNNVFEAFKMTLNNRQVDLSGREEVYLMGYSVFSSKALFFRKNANFVTVVKRLHKRIKIPTDLVTI